MRIQTRLFLGTGLLVLALMAVQWWLHVRQLGAIERELDEVATSVGRGMLDDDFQFFVQRIDMHSGIVDGKTLWVEDGGSSAPPAEGAAEVQRDLHVVMVPGEGSSRVEHRVERIIRPDASIPGDRAEEEPEEAVEVGLVADCRPDDIEVELDAKGAPVAVARGDGRRLELRVVSSTEEAERFLVVSHEGGGERRIPIPVTPTAEIVRGTVHRGVAVGAGLLLVGLVGSGVLASRLSRPLRHLADGAEALGRGELGVQVPVSASGEVGDLQRSFNRMSGRLAELESEREQWRQREHLAQLGDLSRGLAHTLRNPLNALGLAVEELAGSDPERPALVVTARAQIRRIDRWLRSFLALGAGDAAATTEEDLGALTKEVVLEAIQEGARIDLDAPEGPVPIVVVPTAVRAALANLLQNAADASPEGAPVEVSIARRGDQAVVVIADRGPGLPAEVRERLYAPHVTTKVGGSGMGLFLARQLLVGMHGGGLEVTDREGGGTLAEVRLAVLPRPPEDDGS